jgi:hypothetical protein
LSDLARASLASAIELARNDQYDAYLAETLQSIARLQVQIGDTEAARATYALAVFESRGYDAGGWDLDKGLAEVAIAHAERGDFEAALNTLLSLSPGTVERSEAMIDVAAAQARQGRLDEAIDTALHNEGWWRAKALRKVAAVSRRDADPVKLFAILLTAYEVSLRIPKASIRGMAMALTGFELVAAGRKESGLQILAEAADVASTVGFASEGDSDTTEDGQELFRQIAPLQAQAGDFDAALATVNQLYDPDLLRAALDDIERIRKSAAQEDAASVHEQPEAAPVTQTPDIARQRLKEEAARGVRLRDAAIQFCGELARQFPNDAADIEELMRKFAGWLRGKEDSESIRRA